VGNRRVPISKIYTQDPQMLRATEQNLVATATWHPEFVHRRLIKSWSENLNVIYKITNQATNTHICVLCIVRVCVRVRAWSELLQH